MRLNMLLGVALLLLWPILANAELLGIDATYRSGAKDGRSEVYYFAYDDSQVWYGAGDYFFDHIAAIDRPVRISRFFPTENSLLILYRDGQVWTYESPGYFAFLIDGPREGVEVTDLDYQYQPGGSRWLFTYADGEVWFYGESQQWHELTWAERENTASDARQCAILS